MPLFFVEVPWVEQMTIEAPSALDAIRIAGDAAYERRRPWRLAGLVVGRIQAEYETTRKEHLVAEGLLKVANQICEWCGRNAHKSQWGPGYMWCPDCGKTPRSSREIAEEIAAFVAAVRPSGI